MCVICVAFPQIDQASLGLSREYLHKGFEDKLVKEYYAYQVDIAVIFGADRALAEKDMMDVLNFEINMANVSARCIFSSSYCLLLNL